LSTLAHSLGKRDTAAASWISDVLLVVLGSALVAVLAQISVRLPFTPVPVTGQTLAVLLVVASLGPVRGAVSMLLYLAEGAAGIPVFAEGRSGILHLTHPDPLHTTGGYLWGFVVAALVVGFLVERGWDRRIGSALGAMLVGEVFIFTAGVLWLAAAVDVPVIGAVEAYDDALDFGLYPFLIGDLLKMALAAAALPTAWRLVGARRR
jgi:biotin transport system substrate-specific component